MNRRGFLTGLSAVVVAPIVAPAVYEQVISFQGVPLTFNGGCLGISEIVQTTLRNRSGDLAANMMRNNALLKRLAADA